MLMMKAIKAPKFSTKHLYKELDKAQKDFAKIAKKRFQRTTTYWQEKVVFDVSKSDAKRTGIWAVGISTKNEIWNWVNEGTRGPYQIRAKNYPVLVFKVGGKPKTKRTATGNVTSGRGKPGTKTVTKKEVTHPGIEPRQFGVQIVKKLDPVFNRMYRAAWLKGTEEDRMWEGR